MRAYYFVTDDPKKTEHLLTLDGAKERLHLFKADLLEEGAFDPVVDGCEGVFHTASPVSLSPTGDPQVLPSYMLQAIIITDSSGLPPILASNLENHTKQLM